jgi:tetratricopeptide (TPR) repeat protein
MRNLPPITGYALRKDNRQGTRALRLVGKGSWYAVVLLGLVGILLGEGCSGGGEKGNSAQQDSTVSRESAMRDSLRKQLREIDQSLEYASQDAKLYAQRAMVYFHLDKMDSAVYNAKQAVQYDSAEAQYHHALAFYYYTQEKDEKALPHYRKAASLGSENPETYHQMGNSLVMQNKYRASLEWYEKAMEKDSAQALYPFAKAYALREMGQTQAALRWAERSLARDTTFIKTLDLMVDIYLKDLNNIEQADYYNKRILAISQRHPIAAYNAGQIAFRRYLQAGSKPEEEQHLKEAIRAFSRALNSDPSFANAYYNRGYAYQELGKAQKALSDFEMAKRHNPKDPRVYFQMGSIYEYFNEKQRAKRFYKKALELNPGFEDARVALEELGGTPPAGATAGKQAAGS